MGLLIIVVTIWQVARRGTARDNGDVDGVNSYYDHTGGSAPD